VKSLYIENSVDIAEISRYALSMIKRKIEENIAVGLLKKYPVVGMIGARQVGKTTLAAAIAKNSKGPHAIFDLENPEDVARLADPMLALKGLEGLVIIDEVQKIPDIFQVIRVLADRRSKKTRFLILGSASPELLKQSAESLAGRIAYHELGGFSLDEVGINNIDKLWLRGYFPKSYISRSLKDSIEWRKSFMKTYLERDLPQFGISVSSQTLRRFWNMLAHYHAQTWNASEFARSFGVADTTIRHYLDILASTFVVRQLMPWHENISKRQVKAPKIYISDPGILHTLLNIRTKNDLLSHPKLGASWEGFILNQVVHVLKADKDECYFWATHAGAELDLLIVRGSKRIGFEIKFTSSPKITPSMKIALKDLKLRQLFVIHAGDKSYQMAGKIHAIAAKNILKEMKPLA
jgi:uncharacterized protein